MAKKNNFLLVDLNETKTKKLAETITSETSRKILNYLTEKEHDTEANIAKALNIPISTVHYHLQKLKEANLIVVDEFHYSKKGREVNHYKLANKYIIIAPRKVSGLKQALKNVLPVGIVALGISAVIKVFTSFVGRATTFEMAKSAPMLESVANDAIAEAAPVTQEMIPVAAKEICITGQPDIALWFLVGSLSAVVIYLIIVLIKEWFKKN